ncbi:hypothetical protein CSIV_01155 [Microbacterium sp. CSI-V]|nr:hypothetical protein CSIV_01155 [Microbacterium sp. CSI-V]
MRGAAANTSDTPDTPSGSDLRALVGSGDSTRSVRPSSTAGLSDRGGRSTPSPKAGTELADLVGAAMPRSDDRGWMAPELAEAGRRPRFPRGGRGGSVGAFSIVVAIAAVAMLAGTTTFALVQRATANPAVEAMDGLREREAELRNEIKGLQTSSDLLTAVIEDAQAVSQSAAGVLPSLRGRVEDAPLDAADSARTTLDSTVASVPTVVVPDYQRGAVDEQSLQAVGHALDEVRRERDALPALIAQVRTSRSGVTSALDDLRARLRDLGASIETAAQSVVQSEDAAGESFRLAVIDAVSEVRAAQQTGSDGLTEMAAFVAAVDALTAENTRVLDQQSGRVPSRTPSVGTPSPTTPADSGGTGTTDPSTSAPTDPATAEPSPTSSSTPQPGDTATP